MTNEYIVQVDQLSVKFGNFYAVNNITFAVQRGEIFGFLGANGAGKTTTIRVLCGLLHPTTGVAKIGDIEFQANASSVSEMAIKKKVGYMSQKFTLYNDLTIEENFSFVASLRQLNTEIYLQRRNALLSFIAFKRPLNTFIKDLPGGIKQQISLAAALLHDPEIIFLDEPTAGVTPVMRARFWELIRSLADKGKTVFVTTHYMDEAEQCDRIALMKNGKIVALDSPACLKVTAFPDALYELTSKVKDSYQHIARLQSLPEFIYFEPFGLRIHAAFAQSAAAEELQQNLGADFEIKKIIPTLEDVFIKFLEENA